MPLMGSDESALLTLKRPHLASPESATPTGNNFIDHPPCTELSILNLLYFGHCGRATTMAPRDGSQDRISTPDTVEKGMATINTLRYASQTLFNKHAMNPNVSNE